MNWIVVVTRGEARIFTAKDFEEVVRFKSEISRLRNRALTSDKPGLAHGKFGGGTRRYSLTGEKNPHEDAASQFAAKVARYLNKQKNLADLTIVAEPRMEGRLRAALDPKLADRSVWVGKNFGKLSAHELKKRLLGA